MMMQPDLFTTVYPDAPGHANTDTSIEAADAIEPTAATLRYAVLDALEQHGPMTADECATVLCESILSIRPRFTELKHQLQIEDTGARRKNMSGRNAAVFAVTK